MDVPGYNTRDNKPYVRHAQKEELVKVVVDKISENMKPD